MAEKAETGRSGNGLKVHKSALHTVLEKTHPVSSGSGTCLPPGITLRKGNAGFQTLPVLRLTPKDWSTSQLHTITVPPSAHQEVICRKFCKVIAEEIPHISITQSKQGLWSNISLHYRCCLSSRKLLLACHIVWTLPSPTLIFRESLQLKPGQIPEYTEHVHLNISNTQISNMHHVQ